MSTSLRQQAQEYLAMRRALGFKLISQGRTLMGFITYAEGAGATVITAGIALDWARSTRGGVNPAYWAQRLGVVRVFTLHLQTLDPATQIPPAGLLPWRPRRITPYVYSPGEITLLLEAASRLRPRLRAATWHSVLALLTVTGMRVSEVCALDRDDVDLDHGILTVRESKGISRDIPLHPSTAAALGGYARLRDHLRPAPANPAFFISTRGTRLDASNMPRVFRGLLTTAGIRQPPGQRRPRMHDLRHSFTVTSLVRWYRAGADVQAKLPLLTTYLGHADPACTYWYLTGTPELLALAAARLDDTLTGGAS